MECIQEPNINESGNCSIFNFDIINLRHTSMLGPANWGLCTCMSVPRFGAWVWFRCMGLVSVRLVKFVGLSLVMVRLDVSVWFRFGWVCGFGFGLVFVWFRFGWVRRIGLGSVVRLVRGFGFGSVFLLGAWMWF